jgi:diguanylate cyclase (GGDEF)-like protein
MELSFHVILLYTLPLIFASQYKDKWTLWLTYIVVVISMTVASVVGFYYGICDLNILFQSNYRMAHYINSATGAMQNINFNSDPIYILIFLAGFPRAMIAFLFVMMLRLINEQGRKDAVKIARLQWESDTDIPTSTYNKGKYEEMIRDYYPKIGRIAVIFWDINNLKPINDNYGHDVGDIYIKKLADAIAMFSNDNRRKIFRIGGDEFVMIIENPEEREPEKIIDFVQKTLDLEKLRGRIISASSGFSIGFGDMIEEVVKEADANMYFNKRKTKQELKLNDRSN